MRSEPSAESRKALLVRHRPLDVVDHEHVDAGTAVLEIEAKLFGERRPQGRPFAGDAGRIVAELHFDVERLVKPVPSMTGLPRRFPSSIRIRATGTSPAVRRKLAPATICVCSRTGIA